MHSIQLIAFVDEMTKIADSTAIEANDFFGMPVAGKRKRTRRYDTGTDSASGDRTDRPINGDPAPDLGSADKVQNPSGPGGL